MVDLVLAGDNAIVVGMVAASLPVGERRRIIIIGIAAATVMRVMFAVVTVQIMKIVGLLLAGGLLLLWVGWRLWREIEEQRKRLADSASETGPLETAPVKSTRQAIVQIVIADLSMSLDNVLAVAGIARDHVWVLVVGLALSVTFMGLAAAIIARVLEKYVWIAYVGLLVIVYVAIGMIVDGYRDLPFV